MGTLEVFWGHPQGNVLLQASMEIMCSQMGAGSCPSVREAFQSNGGGIFSHIRETLICSTHTKLLQVAFSLK